MPHRLLLAPGLLLLAACATPAATTPTAAECNADAARAYLGRAADADVVEGARQAAGAQTVRTLKPGQIVTLEYLAHRLNLHLDGSGKVERIICG